MRRTFRLQGRNYKTDVFRNVEQPPEALRIITVCYHTSQQGVAITQRCLQSIKLHTHEPYELWLIDNDSPPEFRKWLYESKDFNVILNHTAPYPRSRMGIRTRLGIRKVTHEGRLKYGAVANAVGLEMGLQMVPPATRYVFVCHNDTLVLRDDWMDYLRSKLNDHVKIASVRRDDHADRINALHIMGLLMDYAALRDLNLDLFPRQNLDVGDDITFKVRENNFGEFVCANTSNQPELIDEWLQENNPLREMRGVTHVFDDDHNVFFLHFGRGTPKSSGDYTRSDRTTTDEWLAYAGSVLGQSLSSR